MKLSIDKGKIRYARQLAKGITDEVHKLCKDYTTTSTERTTLRFFGANFDVNVDGMDFPSANRIVEDICNKGDKSLGASNYLAAAMKQYNKSLEETIKDLAHGRIDYNSLNLLKKNEVNQILAKEAEKALEPVRMQKNRRNPWRDESYYNRDEPLKYVIIATGNIHEDIAQAESAADMGADIVAVIRTTAQSLWDYVPTGITTDGFGGTTATQDNFRMMKEALDRKSDELGRYISLVNYSSGLCMPEIAMLGAVEGLDILLNDAMYGILFRDINPLRTFVDQHFSRLICSYADIMINTGEDNYLTTSDAMESFQQVLASTLVNEQFAKKAFIKPRKMGLGHAYEIDPKIENSFLYEIAHAQLIRQVFPDCPIKYMPPTRYKSGDIFFSYLLDGMFNVVGQTTKQGIQLLGMHTEKMHNPHVNDRALSLLNADYLFTAVHDLGDELNLKKCGKINKHAKAIVDETVKMLEEIAEKGLFKAIEEKYFAGIGRTILGGIGGDGVFEKSKKYCNPVCDYMIKSLRKKTGDLGKVVKKNKQKPLLSSKLTKPSKLKINLKDVKPYGDNLDDGFIQTSFVLPIPTGPKAEQAAIELLQKHMFLNPQRYHMQAIGENFASFVVYAKSTLGVDVTAIEVPEKVYPDIDYKTIDKILKKEFDRKIVLVGGCTGSDAHTIGLDAIFNMKGFAGDYGLERYQHDDYGFDVNNLGATHLGVNLTNNKIVEECLEHKADALLISQIVTEKNLYKQNLANLREELETAGLYGKIITIIGGPRLTYKDAEEHGFDIVFASGTKPSQVASFILYKMLAKDGKDLNSILKKMN